MLDIFKNYSAETSILDDFGYYESRQKIILDNKIQPFGAFSFNVQVYTVTEIYYTVVALVIFD